MSAEVETIPARTRASRFMDAWNREEPLRSERGQSGSLSIEEAYRVTAEVCRLRIARGERPIGRKIGFTNRGIWAQYGVDSPIWGHVYDTTVVTASDVGGRYRLPGVFEPRLEPEIVLGLETTPEPGMSESELLGCVGFVAHAFEVVRSIYPDWSFTGPEAVAAGALHGALIVGPRVAIDTSDGTRWADLLNGFEVTLERNGTDIDTGSGSNVLGGPLSALRHLNEVLAVDPVNPPLAAGEIISTGTLTAAYPIHVGERWRTRISGIALDGLDIRFI